MILNYSFIWHPATKAFCVSRDSFYIMDFRLVTLKIILLCFFIVQTSPYSLFASEIPPFTLPETVSENLKQNVDDQSKCQNYAPQAKRFQSGSLMCLSGRSVVQ